MLLAIKSPSQQLVEVVQDYLDGKLPTHEIEDIVQPLLWDLPEGNANLPLAGRLQSLVIERANGHRSEESFRMELANAIRPFVPEVRLTFAAVPERKFDIEEYISKKPVAAATDVEGDVPYWRRAIFEPEISLQA